MMIWKAVVMTMASAMKLASFEPLPSPFASTFASAFASAFAAVVVVAGERVSGSGGAANDGLLLIRSGGVCGGVFTSVWNNRR